MVPQFVSRTAQAAAPGKDNILVVLEMTGGNDGLNTVIPYADDLYHKARPTLRQTKDVVIRLDDHVGLHSGMQGFRPMWDKGQLAVVQGVGYPNPERSHFEAMDIWQSADPKGTITTGWLGRAAVETDNHSGGVPILHVGPNRLPLALAGAPGGGAVTVNDQNSFRLELGGGKVDAAEGPPPAAGGPGRAGGASGGGRPGVVRAAAAGADADGGRDPARAAGRARTPCRGRAAASRRSFSSSPA